MNFQSAFMSNILTLQPLQDVSKNYCLTKNNSKGSIEYMVIDLTPQSSISPQQATWIRIHSSWSHLENGSPLCDVGFHNSCWASSRQPEHG
jgi:hypothetical protein